jgi:murein DD-endopeptidase MepM/ murein hydrolase activator NlpD
MSHDPRDHYYFRRPVDSNANSTSLFYYPYGSAGPQLEWRVHHGLDMPNPDGQPVRAAADGTVVWAADHYRWVEDRRVVDAAESYGNVVIIAHNFGYNGQQLYTLYAHLSKILVTQNQAVTAGQIVGLSGHSGQVSGPHVHFEVREGDNLYFDTRNPLLWMAPLVGDGVVAGRVLYRDGSPVQDATITLLQTSRVVDTTYTYINPKVPGVAIHQVDGDDVWHENFAIGDVPVGHYEVTVSVGGQRFTRAINVQEGTTAYVDFGATSAAPEAPPFTPIP